MKNLLGFKRIRGNAGLIKELGSPWFVTAVLVLGGVISDSDEHGTQRKAIFVGKSGKSGYEEVHTVSLKAQYRLPTGGLSANPNFQIASSWLV